MTLTLEIESSEVRNADVSVTRHTFDERGGTIGRSDDNTWVLAYPNVSARHALIIFRDANFYITDRSSNGIGVNSRDNRLAFDLPHALKSGDRLFVGPYEIRVHVGGPAP